jgi:hypothetical protein
MIIARRGKMFYCTALKNACYLSSDRNAFSAVIVFFHNALCEVPMADGFQHKYR